MKLYNSLTRSLTSFIPIKERKVSIYVCGITPYDTTHLGHAFTYLSFDSLIKYLKYKGFNVEYTQNVTDINDRDNDILKRAKDLEVPWHDLAEYWTKRFLADMEILNWTKPNHYLFASQQIPAMISLVEKLVKKNKAYVKNGSVYLNISEDADYGKLSRLSKDDMLKVAKNFEEDVDNPDKLNPLDITLWRASTSSQPIHIPSFDSPFGKGRPGWHLECSAMSMEYLGEQIDIHGGGKDLIYPHHESEIAQSEGATNKVPFVKYWMHTGAVYYKGEKMSKSLGNLVMVSKLLEKYSPNAIRWVLLSHHWHEDWGFKESELDEAENTMQKIHSVILSVSEGHELYSSTSSQNDIIKKFEEAMENNLNTPKALELILETIRKKPNEKETINQLLTVLGFKFN